MFPVTATNGNCVYSHIQLGGVREARFSIRPLVPMPALSDVPFLDVWTGLHSDDFKPFSVGGPGTHLGHLSYRLFDDLLGTSDSFIFPLSSLSEYMPSLYKTKIHPISSYQVYKGTATITNSQFE